MRRPRTIWLAVAAILATVVVAAIATIFVLLSRYVTTEEMDAATAASRFVTARQKAGDAPALVEPQKYDPSIVRRDPGAPRKSLTTLHVLAYSPRDGEISRADIPMSLVRLATINGRIRLMNFGALSGGAAERITLEDIERHGPGLVVDTRGSDIGGLRMGESMLGANALDTRILIWTE